MKLLAAALLATALATQAQAPAKRPMTFADLQAMKRVSDPQISPSGKWVLFSVMDVSLEKNSKTNHLWVVPLDGSAKEAQVTTGSGETNGRFSPDGKWVMYSSSEGGNSQIWLAPWDETAGRTGPGHVVTALATEADNAIWAPDSTHILFTSSVYPDCQSKRPRPSQPPASSAQSGVAAAFRPPNSPTQSWASAPVGRGTASAPAALGKDRASAVPIQPAGEGASAPEVRSATPVTKPSNATYIAASFAPQGTRLGKGTASAPAAFGKGTASAVPIELSEEGALAPEVRPANSTTSWDLQSDILQRNDEEANCNALKDAVAAKNPVQARIFDHLLYRHWNAYTGPKHSHIFYADVLHGTHNAPTDLTPASVIGDHEAPTFSLGGPLGYAISPDGKEVAYVTNLDNVPAESTNNDIFILQLGAAPNTAKKVSTSPGSDDGPQYSPDGKYLAWRSQARGGFESDKFDLVLLNRFTNQTKLAMPTYRDMAHKLVGDNWVDEFSWSHDGKLLTIVMPDRGEEVIRIASVADTTSGVLDVRLMASGAEFSSPQFVQDSQSLVASRMTIGNPSELVRIVRSTIGEAQGDDLIVNKTDITLLSHLNDSLLSQLQLSDMESFWFLGANNTKVQGFVIRPPNFDPSNKYPLKFLIHGGPQGAWGDAWSYRWNPELFAANGYVVVMINPRGSTGYGQKFMDEVSGDWGGRAYTDLMRGLDYAEQHFPFIDKNRECALGASYGGYMANWILTHTDRFKCIVTHDGMYNPQSAFGTTEELWFNEWEFRSTSGNREKGTGIRRTAQNLSSRPDPERAERVEGEVERPASRDANPATASGAPSSSQSHRGRVGFADTVEETTPAHPWDFYSKPATEDPFRKWSPMLAIKNAHTPTLVIHGQRDYRLDVSEGFQLFTALQLLGVPSKMLYFPDEGHWVLKPKNSELWYETVNDWCDRWTGTNEYAALGPEVNPLATKSLQSHGPNGTRKHLSKE